MEVLTDLILLQSRVKISMGECFPFYEIVHYGINITQVEVIEYTVNPRFVVHGWDSRFTQCCGLPLICLKGFSLQHFNIPYLWNHAIC